MIPKLWNTSLKRQCQRGRSIGGKWPYQLCRVLSSGKRWGRCERSQAVASGAASGAAEKGSWLCRLCCRNLSEKEVGLSRLIQVDPGWNALRIKQNCKCNKCMWYVLIRIQWQAPEQDAWHNSGRQLLKNILIWFNRTVTDLQLSYGHSIQSPR